MLEEGKKLERDGIKKVAEFICIAARTAPKTKGIDNIITGVCWEETKERIAEEMEKIGEITGDANFYRDAKNVKEAEGVVLIGVKINPLGANCGMCRHSCKEVKKKDAVCVFNLIDLGIALGSAVSVAKDFCVDNRIMYRIGVTAQRLKILKSAEIILGIPLSSSGKNIFFDR